MSARLFFLLGFLVIILPLRSFSQYYPAPEPVSSNRLPGLLLELRSAPNGPAHIEALNALSNLYFSIPLKKTSDLAISQKYARQALDESIKTNNQAGRSYALLMLGQRYAYTGDMKSVEELLPLADDTIRAKLLLQISFFYWNNEHQDEDKCIDYAKRAASISEKLGLDDLTLMSRRIIVYAHSTQRIEDLESEMLQLLADHQKVGYKKLHYIYLPFAWYCNSTDRQEKAYYYSEAAVNSVEQTQDSLAGGDVYLAKAHVLMSQERFAEAIEAGHRAVRYLERNSGVYVVSGTYVHSAISAAYSKLGKKEEALKYILQTMKKYPPQIRQDSLEYLERLGHTNRELKRYRNAEYYFQQRYTLNKRAGADLASDNLNLGQLYVESGQYAKSRPFLYKVLNSPLYDAMKKGGKRHIHYMLFLADSASAHYLSAIKHQQFLNNEAAVESRLEIDRAVKKMEVEYRTQEKEQEIKLKNQNIDLLKRDVFAQHEKLRQSQKISLLIAGGLLLMVIVVLLFFFLYRQNKRNSKKIAVKNQLLQKLVSEKEWLLKEVHHRVKNNLHIIFCLLESQARTATEEARTALEKSKNRIYAMSLFHQKVYLSDDIEQVNFGRYIEDFLVFLRDNFDLEERNIRIVHELDVVMLPVRTAMTLALVANEALTNAVKYAFKGRTSGEIMLSLENNEYTHVLTISDNGVGMPVSSFSVNRSLGMDLMEGLCTDIAADIRFEVKNGTTIRIDFTVEEHIEH